MMGLDIRSVIHMNTEIVKNKDNGYAGKIALSQKLKYPKNESKLS